MPELPEVETVRIGLQRLLPGQIIADVDYDWDKSFPNAPADVREFLIGAKVTEVKRRAKVLMIELSTKYSLIVHLKMTGQLVYVAEAASVSSREWNLRATPSSAASRTDGTVSEVAQEASAKSAASQAKQATSLVESPDGEKRWGAGHPSDSLVNPLPDKSTRVTLTFKDGSKLFFNDQRKFGWMRLLPTAEVPNIDFMRKVGPEPLEADFTWQIMKDRLQRRKNTSIKAAILDQSVIAGVGNIYADESLWGARIHPSTLVKNVSDAKIKALHKALVDVLNLSIEKGGSSNRTYVDAEGKKGSYMSFASVFRREDLPCPRCGTVIIKTRVAGRGTHVCLHCQRKV